MIFIGIAIALVLLRVFYSVAEIVYERDHLPKHTWKGLLLALFILILCGSAFAQTNARWDSAALVTQGQGQLIPVLAQPGVTVGFFTGCSVLPCVSPAVTYQGPTGSATCPSGQQVVWQWPLPQSCSSTADSQGNFGGYFQSGSYQYTISYGGTTRGPYQFTVGGGGSSSGGVTSINTVAGAFTFNGAGVSCTSTTCTFSNTASGVDPGTASQMAYYADASHVAGDAFFTDTAPLNPTSGSMTYTGVYGASFTTNAGGIYNFGTKNSASSPSFAPSMINITTEIDQVPSTPTGAGDIVISTKDTTGTGQTANMLIQTVENAGTANNSANLTLNSIGGAAGTDTGNINIFSNGNDAADTNGNINLTSTGGSSTGIGGNLNLTTIGQTGGSPSVTFTAINLLANSGFSPITALASNWSVDQTGNFIVQGNIQTAGKFNSATLAPHVCLEADSGNNIVPAVSGLPCGAGGGSSGITGQVLGTVPLAGSSTTLTSPSHLDEVSNPGFDTFSLGVIINDGTGVGGGPTGTEGTVPAAGSGVDTLWADAVSHRWRMNPNNSGSLAVVGIATAGAAGDSVVLATNGIDVVDSPKGTPTFTADSGSGGSPTITITSGSTDFHGWVNVTTGTSPSASAGVVTIKYGNTYTGAIPKCDISAANGAAAALNGNAAVWANQSTSTLALFVINVGSTALAGATAYQWEWSCGR